MNIKDIKITDIIEASGLSFLTTATSKDMPNEGVKVSQMQDSAFVDEAMYQMRIKLDAATEALRQIECLTVDTTIFHKAHTERVKRIHTIAQTAWRASRE